MTRKLPRAMSDNPYAPLFHFSPEEGWINDPNGLVYFGDRWHLFYQYYNAAQVDGMQWGHATSEDLVHWTHHKPALSPDKLGHIWSGSAVVDAQDSSGFFGGKPGMVCAYTYWNPEDHWQCQGIAYSADGIHFEKYEGNPVIPELRELPGHPDDKDFRDPKLFWHEPTQRWVMIVAGGKFRVFTSTNLRDWTFETLQEEIYTECPDLFPIKVEGEPETEKWVLSGGGRWYQIGHFDGKRFKPESETIPFGHGPDFYATQSWNNAPHGRRVAISWLFAWAYKAGPSGGRVNNPFPTGSNAGGCLTVPMELRLVRTARGLRLRMDPVAELQELDWRASEDRVTLGSQETVVLSETGKAFDLDLETADAPQGDVVLHVPANSAHPYSFGYDSSKHALFIDRTRSKFKDVPDYPVRHEVALDRSSRSEPLRLRALIDRNSVELFGQDGEIVLSAIIHPSPDEGGLVLSTSAATPVECEVRLKRLG